MNKWILAVYAAYLAIASLITFVMYKIDKVKAEKKKWRIRESTLLGFGFFGGAAGAVSGMEVFRHKTKHWQFKVFFPLLMVLQIILAALICLKWLL